MSDCNCKCCHDHGAILRAHAGVEDVVRDTAEEAMRDSGMMPERPHSDTYMLEAFRQIHRQARETLDFIAGLPYAAEMVLIINGLAFIRTRAYEALQPVTICDPPDNGIFTSPGEMAGNPSCNDINDFHTRTL